MASTNLALPYLEAAQAQKHLTVNDALRRLDALVQANVVSAGVTAQPGSPGDGQMWILPVGKTGAAWGPMAVGSIAYWRDGAWEELVPKVGWRAFDRAVGRMLTFAGAGAWSPLDVLTAHGAGVGLAVREEELTLSGAFVAATAAIIPARSIVLAVSCRTTAAVTGASAYDCGIAGENTKFGGSLGAAAGSTNIGVIGPTAFYSDTPVRISAVGSNFTGGKVRVALSYFAFAAPSS